ncbi:MAG: glycosyltransferase [Campylobacterota bacterium]|nr:glycosyltransferase [Campylobacterota bacterium]
MKKIANIVFNPFTNDSRVIKESASLANNGYYVEVIAHLDKGLEKTQVENSFIVKRFSYLDRIVSKSKLAKLKAYLLYVKEASLYCKDFDILHCNDLNALPIAFIIKKLYNKDVKIVYDAHEYETEVNGLGGFQKYITKKAEQFFIRYANAVICVSDAIADEYVRLYDIPKPSLVLNTPAFKSVEKKDIFREVFGIKKEQTIFLYQGALSQGRGVQTVLDTFKMMQSDESVIIFMGYGNLEAEIQKLSAECSNIYFHKAVSPEVLLDYTSSADFGIATIEDSCLSYRYCLPNKIFEYTMANLPVIVSNLPEMKKLVLDNSIGVVVKEDTSSSLKKAILEAVTLDKDKLQINIQKVKEIYNWEEQEKVLLELYTRLEE